ncbi:MAG: PilZ domain-containing protein [Acidobacteriia bacterium]|nr:PilZ domain-containing protein [Terriglobia bacterium]
MSSQLTKASIVERQAKRHASHYRELFITYEGHSEEIPLRPPDLSVKGMFIQTARRFPEGAVLKVRFRLVRSFYEVLARAEVRYCLPGVGIGIEFVEISSEARNAIREELRDGGIPVDDSI